VLLAVYDVVTAAASPGQRIVRPSLAARHFYLIEQQIGMAPSASACADTAGSCRGWADGPSAGFPRIYEAGAGTDLHMDGAVDRTTPPSSLPPTRLSSR